MFDKLTRRLDRTWSRIRGRQLTEKNIAETLKEVRLALIDADVALEVIDKILADVQEKAIGHSVQSSLTPAHTLLKIIYDEFVQILGAQHDDLKLPSQAPAVIMVAGLQGSGKTTTVAKLAHHLIQKEKKAVLVVSVDIYRPGAIEQLKAATQSSGAQFFATDPTQSPQTIAKNALDFARSHYVDVVIVDTAGRLHIDAAMMDEIRQVHHITHPDETLYVLDSMVGQDAIHSARAFNDALPLTGLILTKVDGDARGGAALSVSYLTKKSIKFIGVGEKIDAFEVFHPDRIASRILGEGDLLSLVEEAQRHIQPADVQKMAGKLKKGEFDLNDFRNQINQLSKMGGISNLMSKLPGMANMGQMLDDKMDPSSLTRICAMIDSMTPEERVRIDLMVLPQNKRLPPQMKKARSRIERIARGSGTDTLDVKKMLKQFKKMQDMMKKMGKGNMMSQMLGQFAPNLPFNVQELMKENPLDKLKTK